MTTTANPSDLLATVTGLLRAEHGCLFRFIDSADPYIARSAASLRRPLQDMISAAARHEGELMAIIDQLGGIPTPPGVSPDHQYLAFLSLEFLRPRLKAAAEAAVARYTAAIAGARAVNPAVAQALESHLADYRRFVDALDKPANPANPAARN